MVRLRPHEVVIVQAHRPRIDLLHIVSVDFFLLLDVYP